MPTCTPPIPIEVIGLEYLEPGGSWVPINGNIDVLDGTEVKFRALKNTVSPWPPGQPVWNGLNLGTTGETVTSTFTGSGIQTVQVNSGTSTRQFTVTKYDLSLHAEPSDNFPGRSLTSFGLKESVILAFTTTNSAVTPESLKYEWHNDENSRSALDESYTHTFGLAPRTVKFTLMLRLGPSSQQFRTLELQVIAPRGGRLIYFPCAGLFHDQGIASAGFFALATILPSNVAFPGVMFREGGGRMIGTGYFGGMLLEHIPTPVLRPGKRSPKYGNYYGYDNVLDTWQSPYSAGTSRWPIDWQYEVGPGQFVTFTQVSHDTLLRADGSISITKGGSPGFTFQLNDPNSFRDTSCLGDPPP